MDLIEVSDNQNRHPWELSRTACVLKQLRKLGIHGNVLDIGCGDGYFDRRLLEECPGVTVYGMDIYLKDEIHEGNFHAVSSPEHLPDMKFDFILMMDVLEHIENDRTYLREIARKYLTADRVAKNGDEAGGGGYIIITVPAFNSLYSLHDKELRHFRRYNHRELGAVIADCGLTEKRWTYFYFSLILGRLLTKNKTENLSQWQKPETDFITKFVVWVLNTDFSVCNALSHVAVHLPGLSLLSVCKIKKL